ncbi:SDR family NAD(P)-dependent oxidoreductase [Sphaerisporangium fuscum]|uniref:SDR family NAD(P)-dependent oxidoreductase n=1 Tax=Sphaerisporangium fuscum TaxID=2835868 RepID=UPI001BDBB825|nr:SDR family NAD(P)-dependent oxidoreductase [Sphaerisporangium fuscum]
MAAEERKGENGQAIPPDEAVEPAASGAGTAGGRTGGDGAPRRGRRAFMGLAAAAAGAAGLAGAVTVPPFLTSPPTSPPPAAPPRGRFAGKVVLITGATSGIGEATAKAFAAEGAKVAFCGRRVPNGQRVEREIRAAGGTARYTRADVRDAEQVRRFVDETVATFGGLDVAFNNAGILRSAPLHELPPETWTDVLDTNARGVLLSIRYEVPHMLKAGRGVIICTTSESRRPGGVAYTASKQAIKGIVEVAAMDYGPKGIRVNAIAPGTTDTPLVRPAGLPDALWTAFKRAWGPLNVSALQRMATPEEIARAVVSLATDEFAYMAGSTVLVNGGPRDGGPMRMPPGFPSRS